jgi:transcriptional regulator with XRE-family HTH domain
MAIDDQQRRRELAEFLQSRRAKVTPEQVGIHAMGRRRLSGLRREEVSQLAGVSLTWYTWLEQGRDIQVSSHVLNCLARVLQLTPTERDHLFVLARQELRIEQETSEETVSPDLQRILDFHEPSPAYIMGKRWDLLAWNKAICRIFGDYSALHERERNVVWAFFTDPARKRLIVDWEREARLLVAQFRASAGLNAGDPFFTEFVENLSHVSEDFRAFWSQHDVMKRPGGYKIINHPEVGKLVLQHNTFLVSDQPNLKLVLFTPMPEADTQRKLEMLASQG